MNVSHSKNTPYGMAALRAAGGRIAGAERGGRNVTLYEAARSMGRLVGGGQLSTKEATPFLVELGQAVGISEVEARRQVRNGIQRGQQAPKRPKEEPRLAPDEIGVLAAYRGVWRDAWAQPGGGRSQATTLRLVAALCLCGVRSGSLVFRAGHRRLADVSGTSPGTVTKHLARLEPWFVRTSPGDRGEAVASTWETNGNRCSTEPSKQYMENVFPFDTPLLEPAHPVWCRWSNGWRVFCLLADGLGDVDGLAARTGLSPASMRRILRRLAERSLASVTPEGWVARFEGFDEGSVAHVVEARRARRRRERLRYLHFLVWRMEQRAARDRVDPRTGEVLAPGRRIVLGPDLFLGRLSGFWREVIAERPCGRAGSVSVHELAARFRFCEEHRAYVAQVVARRPR